MNLATADIVILCVAAGGLVLGGFFGFSGALAFVAGAVAASLVGHFGWPFLGGFFVSTWARVLALVVLTLLSFGIVRALVRKMSGLMLAQPADFIFGALIGAATAGVLAVATAWGLVHFGLTQIDSAILREVLGFVG